MVYKLYRTPIPRDALRAVAPSVRRQLAQAGVLNGEPTAQNIAGTPPDLTLRGSYRGTYAEMLGTEIRELLQSNFTYLPLYEQNAADTLAERGFYIVQQGQSGRAEPRSPTAVSFDGALVRSNTRASAWVAVATNPTQPAPGNDFGTATTARLGVPAAATRVRWYNPETGVRAEPVVQATHEAEFGTLELVDAQAAPFASPTLIYDLPYERFGDVDVGVWDTYDRPKRDGDGTVAWQRVFDSAHDYRGASVIDTGRLRLYADDSDPDLSAETWDDTAGEWTPVALGTSDWELYDWDVRAITPVQVTVIVEFRDATQSPAAYTQLRGIVTRGRAAVQWLLPTNTSGPVPAGLQTLLDPIADPSVVTINASTDLLARTEVNYA